MLNRPNGFDYFFQTNNIITQSEIKICSGNGVELLTMAQIERVETHLKNSFLCSYYPTEETTIEIIGWNSIASGYKDYLTTKGNFVYIRYGVGGIWTTGCRVGIIDEYQTNFRQNRATIRCVGVINSKELTKANALPLYVLSRDNSWTAGGALSLSLIPKDNKTMTFNIDNNFTTMANLHNSSLTQAETIQNLCTACGGSVRVNYDNDTQTFIAGVYDINHVEECVMSMSNIYDDVSIKIVENYTEVNISGYTLGTAEQVYTAGFYTNTGNFQQSGAVPTGYVIASNNNMYVVISNTTFRSTGYIRNGNSITASFSTGSYVGGGDFYIVAQKYVAPTYAQTNTALGIISYLLPDDNTTQKDIIKNNALHYLSCNKEVSFSGRINPALEPLDYLDLNDGIGIMIVEEVSLVFNGAFSGRVKGVKYMAKAPIKVSSFIPYPDEFQIKVQNPNPFDLTLAVVYSGGVEYYEMSAGETLTLDQNNADYLYNSIDEWLGGSLLDPVHCYFVHEGMYGEEAISDNTIILEN